MGGWEAKAEDERYRRRAISKISLMDVFFRLFSEAKARHETTSETIVEFFGTAGPATFHNPMCSLGGGDAYFIK